MNYSEKLRNPLWQKKRLEILQRDDFTCQLCSDKETELQVHHREYKKGCEPWEYPNDNFKTLCKHCHGIVSSYDLEILLVKKILRQDGVNLTILATCYSEGQTYILVYSFVDNVLSYKEIVPAKAVPHMADIVSRTEKLL